VRTTQTEKINVAAGYKNRLVVFPAPFGWIALVGCGDVLRNLGLGDSPRAAVASLSPDLLSTAAEKDWNRALVRRLQAYAEGKTDDFRDVPIDPGPQTDFRLRVIQNCRQIPPGSTLTYGELAARAGRPRAARAVGTCMAANRIPLIVPCHRVVGADGSLRGYSASGGLRLKQRLLDLESRHILCGTKVGTAQE
jgi:methylated-DNA-[protein]-cysteine S-methyltransferase